MKEIFKLIRYVVLFLLFSGVAYVAFLCIWGDIMPGFLQRNMYYRMGYGGHMFTRMEEVKHVKNVDVLFLGSSHAYRGFDPRIFAKHGLKSFNLGSSLQSPMQTEVLLNRYLHTINPKVIIYEVYYPAFTSDGVESALDIISNDKNDLESVKMIMNLNHIGTTNTFIYGLCNDLIGATNAFNEDSVKGEDTYVKGGYVQRASTPFKNAMKESPWKYDINDHQWNTFIKLIHLIKNKNIKLILVQTPISKSLYKTFEKKEAFNKMMKQYGEYYNFNEILQLDDSLHFYDPDHLNQAGVEIFNDKLIHLALSKQTSGAKR